MIITVIGLGEVGGYYATGLSAGGAKVRGYDISLTDPRFSHRIQAYREAGVTLYESEEEAISGADIILALTNSSAALKTAEAAKPYLYQGQIYVEFNSAVPEIKKAVETLLAGTAEVVDGTTMASASQLKHKTPVNLSGWRAQEVSEILNHYGMNTQCIGDEVGQASMLKVLRSVFMKGFEAVLMECMQAAHTYQLSNQVMQSILDFFDTKPLKELLVMFITTDAIHCRRRAEEVEAITGLLEKQGIEDTMSVATVKKLKWISSLGMEADFDGVPPEMIDPVLSRLCKREQTGR